MRRELSMSSPEEKQACATSCVAASDTQAVGSPGAGGHCAPGDSIPATTVERNPLTDPRAGDIVAAACGGVIEIVDVVLGHGAGVWVREDSTRYAITHEGYRDIVKGGRVIHRAEGEA